MKTGVSHATYCKFDDYKYMCQVDKQIVQHYSWYYSLIQGQWRHSRRRVDKILAVCSGRHHSDVKRHAETLVTLFCLNMCHSKWTFDDLWTLCSVYIKLKICVHDGMFERTSSGMLIYLSKIILFLNTVV